MVDKRGGFTIVELLIVIVVIAILAAISIVAFNGVQARAENNKTITAATAYIKAIKLYEIDKGEIPHVGLDSCIGTDYSWDYAGIASGNNQCRSTSSSYYYTKGTLNDELRSYSAGNLPQPSMQAVGNTTSWARGVTYSAPAVGGNMQLYVAFKGISTCPMLGGIAAPSYSVLNDGIGCNYIVGKRIR